MNSDCKNQDKSCKSDLKSTTIRNVIKENFERAEGKSNKRGINPGVSKLCKQRLFVPKNRTCDICQKSFKKPWYLLQHNKSVHLIDFDYHACEVCKKVFRSKNVLKCHVKLIHSNPEKKYSCDICLKMFKTRSNLKAHKSLHASETVECGICNKTMKHNVYLQRHVKNVHSNKEPMVCEICGNSYKALGFHMKMYHSGVQKFTCQMCNKVFNTERNLQRHNNYVHLTSEKKIMCHICGAQFKDKPGLLQHSVVHNEERNFKCDICGKTFKHKVSLKNHLRVHNDVQPYTCEKCGEKFKWHQTYVNHSAKCSISTSVVNS